MAQERILIVDGDIPMSEMLKDRLEVKGYLVDCARTGKGALNILNNEWVDLIVLAVVLQGGIHGFRLFKEIKRRKKFSKIPIIMHTKKAGMKEMFKVMGAEAFFAKPCCIDSFLNKIEEILVK